MTRTIEIDHLVVEPEENLLLGNDGLSVASTGNPARSSGALVRKTSEIGAWTLRLPTTSSPRRDPASHTGAGWITSFYVDGKGKPKRGKWNASWPPHVSLKKK